MSFDCRTSDIFEGPLSDPSDLDQDDWVHCGDGSIPVCTPDETFNGEIQDDGNKWFKDLRASAKHIKILRTLRSEGENRPSLPTTVKDIEEIKPINEHREMDKWPKRLRKLVELSVVMRKSDGIDKARRMVGIRAYRQAELRETPK